MGQAYILLEGMPVCAHVSCELLEIILTSNFLAGTLEGFVLPKGMANDHICLSCGKQYTEALARKMRGVCCEGKAAGGALESIAWLKSTTPQKLEELLQMHQAGNQYVACAWGFMCLYARHPSAALGSTDPTSGLPDAEE
eukprot:1067301-Amphidinium_carterae.1